MLSFTHEGGIETCLQIGDGGEECSHIGNGCYGGGITHRVQNLRSIHLHMRGWEVWWRDGVEEYLHLAGGVEERA